MYIIRRFGLSVYWVAFAAYVVHQGQFPGFTSASGPWQYNWAMAIIVLAVLAIAVGILHMIIRPMSYDASSPRFGKAFGYSVVLLFVFSSVSAVTDMPPVFYVPSLFAIVTVALTFLAALAEAIGIEVRKRRR